MLRTTMLLLGWMMIGASVRGAEPVAANARADARPGVSAANPPGTRGEPRRVKTLLIDKPGIYENYLVDAEWGEVDAVRIKADGVTLRNCEIRNGRKDAIEVYAADVIIENCKIHHFLAGSFKEQKDAHGITGRPVRLTIRNCEIGYLSGDCLQFDPGRGKWGDVVVENCRLFAAALPEDAGDFKKGESPGENGVDTKQVAANPRSKMTIRNCLIEGFSAGGQISNRAGLNLKNNVEVVVEKCWLMNNEIGLRLRGAGKSKELGGAQVVASDCVFEDCDTAIRAEEGIEEVKMLRPAFGAGVKVKLKQVGGKGFKMVDEKVWAGAQRGEVSLRGRS